MLIYSDITERKRNEAEIRAARDAAEEASRTIEAAYRDLKTAQANLIQAEKMASWDNSPPASRTRSRTRSTSSTTSPLCRSIC